MDFQQAVELHRQGDTDNASTAYESILSVEPAHLDALVHLGALRLAQGRPEDAEALLRRALVASPSSPEAQGNLAATLQVLGRYQEAVTHYERALELRPDLAVARFGLATCLQRLGHHEAAIGCYEAILEIDPENAEAHYGLATLLELLGREDDAIAKYRAALAADPDFAEASYGLGKIIERSNSPGEAVDCFLHALDVDPDFVEARFALGTTLCRLDRDKEAMAAFRAVLASEPRHLEAICGVGLLLAREQRLDEAMEQYRSVLAQSPENVDALAGMAFVLKSTGQHPEALELARRVVALRPNFAPAANLLGSILVELGLIEQAQVEHRRAVALAPRRPESLYHLALSSKFLPGDKTISMLEEMAAQNSSLPPREQCFLYFTLAKAYEDIGERNLGFDYLLRGNSIKRSQMVYHEAGTLAAMDRIRDVLSAEFMASRLGHGDRSPVPVFIVGMPRSGTTLVEQTLASHHAVFGAGERVELSRLVGRIGEGRSDGATYPEATMTLSEEQLHQIGADYVSALQRLAPAAARITDKMPGNFLFAGLIALILPNARIIHTVRDPVDTCLSCYSQLFTVEQGFSYDLGELGRYYRAYRRLMEHWRTVVPAGVMLEVNYEDIVNDFESQARRIVAHCGQEWDPSCLEFYRTSRPVHTASMTQVRQPIYRSSVGRWRPSDVLLRPLMEALAGT